MKRRLSVEGRAEQWSKSLHGGCLTPAGGLDIARCASQLGLDPKELEDAQVVRSAQAAPLHGTWRGGPIELVQVFKGISEAVWVRHGRFNLDIGRWIASS